MALAKAKTMDLAQQQLWQKIQYLKPQLATHIIFSSRQYHDERWILLQDNITQQFHRMSLPAFEILKRMNGKKNLKSILAECQSNEKINRDKLETLDQESSLDHKEKPEHDHPPEPCITTEAEIIKLIQYLHIANLLICDFTPSTESLFSRKRQDNQKKWWRYIANPLIWKLSLGNPNDFLKRLAPLGYWITTPLALAVWCSIVSYALLQSLIHWPEISQTSLTTVLSGENLLLLWLTYPVLKIIHEIAHGLLTIRWGGEVNHCGITFIVGTPLPYVDASAATAFHLKRHRILVSAAGMAVEIFTAALAFIVWLQLEPGFYKTFCFNIVLIGGVSTLLFNGNPLMKFDGYHILCDILDTPNLASRANKQFGYMVHHFIYGTNPKNTEKHSLKGTFLLVFYSFSAVIYRLIILISITLLLADHYPSAAVIMGVWLASFQVFWPALRYLKNLTHNPAIKPHRIRVFCSLLLIFSTAIIFIGLIPMPNSTQTQGVTWVADDYQVRAQSSGVIVDQRIFNGEKVEQGQTILRQENPDLKHRETQLINQLKNQSLLHDEAWSKNRADLKWLDQEISRTKSELALTLKKLKHLEINSPKTGVFKQLNTYQLKFSHLKQGDIFGVIEHPQAPRIRAVLTQAQIGRVNNNTEYVSFRFSSKIHQDYRLELPLNQASASRRLPHPILGTTAGGSIPVSQQGDGIKTEQLIFILDLNIMAIQPTLQLGERVYIRFHHPKSPLAQQWFAKLQQFFQTHFK